MTQTVATPSAPPAPPMAAQPARAVDTIVIHCSATHSGQALGNGTHGSAAAVIDRWHAARGFARAPDALRRFNSACKSIGYHFVIDVDGRCDLGRAIAEVGAHAAGHNARSIGICLVGGLEPVGRYSAAQWGTLADLVASLSPASKPLAVVGHRDLSPDANHDGVIDRNDWLKTCPGFDVAAWRAAGMRPLPQHLLAGAGHD